MILLVGGMALLVIAVGYGFIEKYPDEGRVDGDPWLLGTTSFDLAEVGYEQSEYFIKGTAHSYISRDAMNPDGKWQVTPQDAAEFKTRIVIYRPVDPARFNGTVVFEWFNVSGGTEASSEWIMGHTELIRGGYVWVGVSAQQAGIDGGGVTVLPLSLPLKRINPYRYRSLVHPGDKFSFDIFHQAAKAVLQPQGFRPLEGLKIERAIATGESQSADYLLTYVNAIAPREPLFDAYLIHSRVHGSAALSPGPGATTLDFESRAPVRVRDDLGVPVLMLQTETDMTILKAYADRQPDTEYFRLWEVAGTAHADRYVGHVGLTDKGNDLATASVEETNYAIPVLFACGRPINSGPQHFVLKAAIAALDRWVRTGVAPPAADRFEYDGAQLVRDQFGNVVGGIRTPYVDVPIAMLSGEGQTDSVFCSLYGSTALFDRSTLLSLYGSHREFKKAVDESVGEAVKSGYVLPEDGSLIKDWASAFNFPDGLD